MTGKGAVVQAFTNATAYRAAQRDREVLAMAAQQGRWVPYPKVLRTMDTEEIMQELQRFEAVLVVDREPYHVLCIAQLRAWLQRLGVSLDVVE